MAEQRFEYRIAKLLEKKGYLVINCARSKPFDLVAIKNQVAYPIELKAKGTYYPPEQMTAQEELCIKTNTRFFLIRQSEKRGKFSLTRQGETLRFWPHYVFVYIQDLDNQLFIDLEEYLVL